MRRWAVIVLVLTLVACGGGGTEEPGPDDDGEQGPATTTGGEFDPDALAIYVAEGSRLTRIEPDNDRTDELVTGLEGCFETWYLDDSVFVSCTEGRLLRVDPDNGDILLDVETGDYIEEIDVGEGAIWVLNGAVGLSTEVNQIDLDSGEILATVTPEAGAFFEDLAVGGGAVWVVGGSAASVSVITRIDPTSATADAPIDVGMIPARVVADGDGVFVVGGGFRNPDGTGGGLELARLDPGSGEVTSRLTVGETDGFPDLAFAFGSVWLTDTAAGELVRVDPDVTEVLARTGIGSGGQDIYEIDVAKGLVWAGNPFDSRIYGVSPETDAFEAGIDGGAEGIAFDP
jgi:hypothetical protein